MHKINIPLDIKSLEILSPEEKLELLYKLFAYSQKSPQLCLTLRIILKNGKTVALLKKSNKVKVAKRRCYGLAAVKTIFQRLFLDFQGLEIYA